MKDEKLGWNFNRIAYLSLTNTLHLSIGTVKNYITHILSKLKMRDYIAAALWAKENLN